MILKLGKSFLRADIIALIVLGIPLAILGLRRDAANMPSEDLLARLECSEMYNYFGWSNLVWLVSLAILIWYAAYTAWQMLASDWSGSLSGGLGVFCALVCILITSFAPNSEEFEAYVQTTDAYQNACIRGGE